ncbi:MAG: SDR family NAD(P)-dependent oxidoreductase, partial [Acidimicrobiia bacterium]|nr:SDR family NAD(P)-dependent oxidoreductase [Acidimicrobiia bacterium]
MSPGAALVTGAGGALGRAIAERLASDGYQVAVVDIDIDSAQQTVEAIEAAGGTALAIECDLRDEHQIAAAFSSATKAFGPVLTLVNNAAIFPLNAFVDTPIE